MKNAVNIVIALAAGLACTGAAAAPQYVLECRGGGDLDLVTFYRHSHSYHTIIWKFRWAQDEQSEPKAGECRYIGPSSGFPRPGRLLYKGHQKDGYGAEFGISRDKNVVRAFGPENDSMNRRLLNGPQLPNLQRFCVTYDDYDGSYEIKHVQYVKGFKVKGMATRNGCS